MGYICLFIVRYLREHTSNEKSLTRSPNCSKSRSTFYKQTSKNVALEVARLQKSLVEQEPSTLVAHLTRSRCAGVVQFSYQFDWSWLGTSSGPLTCTTSSLQQAWFRLFSNFNCRAFGKPRISTFWVTFCPFLFVSVYSRRVVGAGATAHRVRPSVGTFVCSVFFFFYLHFLSCSAVDRKVNLFKKATRL